MSDLSSVSSDKDYNGSSSEDNIVILEMMKDLSSECHDWLLERLTSPLTQGGAELEVKLLVEYKKKLVYHVGAGTDRLIEAAELMQLRKKWSDDSVSEFNMNQFFNMNDYNDKEKVFSSKERQEIVLHEIESVRYHKNLLNTPEGLPDFYEDQAIFSSCKQKKLIDYFPLHDKKQLQDLNQTWVKSFFSKQPLDRIHSYFGDSISFYFAFLGFYTRSLAIPAILGLVFQALSFFFSNMVVAIFCVFNIIWTSVFLVLWKRKCAELAYKWGANTYSKYDEPRAQFRGMERGKNPVTGRLEPLCNSRSKYYRFYSISLPIILLSLLLCLLLGVAYFIVESWVIRNFNSADPPTRDTITMWGTGASTLLTCVYGAIIYFFDMSYRKIAVKLNDYENHRLQSTYDNFLVVKLVAFNFVNYFIGLFYVAFYLQDFHLLAKDLATLLITFQVIQQFQEAVIPYYAYKLKKKTSVMEAKRQMKGKLGEDEGGKGGGVDEGVVEESANQVGKDTSKERYPGTLDDFLELFLQFGYVYLFSAVFPTAAFWAFLNNVTEIRSDGFKLCYIHRRPFTSHCQGIGAWLPAFEMMGVVAVVTNCALVAMTPPTSQLLSQLGWSPFTTLVLFIVIEHILLFTKAAITYLVSPTPDWIKIKMAKIQYDRTLAWKENKKQELRPNGVSSYDKKVK